MMLAPIKRALGAEIRMTPLRWGVTAAVTAAAGSTIGGLAGHAQDPDVTGLAGGTMMALGSVSAALGATMMHSGTRSLGAFMLGGGLGLVAGTGASLVVTRPTSVTIPVTANAR